MKFRVGWLIASTRCIWRCIYTHQSIYTRSHLQWPDYTACYLPPRINAPSIRCTLLCIHPYTHVRLRHARSAPVSLTSTTHRRLINSTIPKTVLRYYHSRLFIHNNTQTITDPEPVQCLFKSKRNIHFTHTPFPTDLLWSPEFRKIYPNIQDTPFYMVYRWEFSRRYPNKRE